MNGYDLALWATGRMWRGCLVVALSSFIVGALLAWAVMRG